LAGGLLAGPRTDGGRRRESESIAAARAARAGQLEAFHVLCAELGETPGVVALAWLLHQPGVTSTIIGPGNLDQLKGVLGVPGIVLDPSTLDRLDHVFPPCGAAPEAYAW
jgi:aryl-alcohol dehydrogenase-like predicted oxidoreductase